MKTVKRHALLSIAMLGALLLGAPFAVHAACISDPNTPGYNHDLEPGCGIDIILILDESSSIAYYNSGNINYTSDVVAGAKALLDSFKNTGSRVAMVEFGNVSRLVKIPGFTQGNYVPITDTTLFDAYLDNHSNTNPDDRSGYNPRRSPLKYTNWQDALQDALTIHVGAAPNQGPADLVVFLTDGNPTVSDNCPTESPFSSCALGEAITAANNLKNSGPDYPHLFVVAVGGNINVSNIEDISGCDELTLPADLQEVLVSDYTQVAFAQLAALFRQVSFALCSPSLTVTKKVDPDGPNFPTQPVVTPDIQFTGVATIVGDPILPGDSPASNDYEWVDPQVATSCPSATPSTGEGCPGPGTANDPDNLGTTQNGSTSATGILGFTWIPNTQAAPKVWNSQIVLSEQISNTPYYFRVMTCNREHLNVLGNIETTDFTCTRESNLENNPDYPDYRLDPGVLPGGVGAGNGCTSSGSGDDNECTRATTGAGFGPVVCGDIDTSTTTIPMRSADIVTCEVINDDISKLPVTLNHFSSSEAGGSIEFKWDTLSETDMLGFRLWVVVEGQRVTLGERLVLSNSSTSATPQSYKVSRSVTDLVAPPEAVGITSVDIDGAEQHFGPHKIGEIFGERVEPKAIDWEAINASVDEEMERAGYRKSGKRWVRQGQAAANGDSGITE